MLGWIESHPGTAAWVQAIGGIAAVVAVFVIARSDQIGRRRREQHEHNQLVDLFAELGERARASTNEALLLVFSLADKPVLGTPHQLTALRSWRPVIDDVREAISTIPRDRIRDPLLSYAVAQLVRALDVESQHRMASSNLTTAQDVLNDLEIKIGAALEGIRARRR